MFMVMFGVMQLTSIGPNLLAITEGRIAGKLAYDVIDSKPAVQVGVGKPLTGEIQGKIEFEKIKFNYPTRPDLKVLKELSCTFEAG